MLLPTIPVSCSVFLSERDRAYILRRRQQFLAARSSRLGTRVLVVATAVAVVAWGYNIALLIGGVV